MSPPYELFHLSRGHGRQRMTNISRYLVNVSHLCYAVVPRSFPPERWLSLTFLPSSAAPLDLLAPRWGCAGCGGSPGTALLPGPEPKALESKDVPGCWSRSHSPQRRPEPGEDPCLVLGGLSEPRALCDFTKCSLHLLPQDELESYAYKSIYRCDAVNSEKHFPSLLLLVCQSAEQKKPDIHFFNCETVKVSSRSGLSSPSAASTIRLLQVTRLLKPCLLQAEQIRDDIARAVSDSSRRKSKNVPDDLR